LCSYIQTIEQGDCKKIYRANLAVKQIRNPNIEIRNKLKIVKAKWAV